MFLSQEDIWEVMLQHTSLCLEKDFTNLYITGINVLNFFFFF